MKSISYLLSVFLLPPDLRHDFQVSFWWDGDEVIVLVVPVAKKFPTVIEVQLYCNKQQLEACPPFFKIPHFMEPLYFCDIHLDVLMVLFPMCTSLKCDDFHLEKNALL